MGKELEIKRRHLPHWTLDGSVYFVTFRLRGIAMTGQEQTIVLDHIKEGEGKSYDCFAAVVMPDHVHLLLRPFEGTPLSKIMHGIKGVSAHKINQHRKTTGAVWQDESFDRIVRNKKEFDQKFSYMYNNPLANGLTSDPSRYIGWYSNIELNQ